MQRCLRVQRTWDDARNGHLTSMHEICARRQIIQITSGWAEGSAKTCSGPASAGCPNCTTLLLLVRIGEFLVLPPPELTLPLVDDVLPPHFGPVLCLELADELRIPEFTRNSEVLAAPHESVTLASLRGGGHAGGVEVLLLSTGYRDKAAETDEAVLAGDNLAPDVCLSTRSEAPAARPKGFVQDPPVLDLREVDEPVWLDLNILRI